MNDNICIECGGRKDRYGLYDCDKSYHPSPKLVEKVVADIEASMRDRKGFGFAQFDKEIQWEIRDEWINYIQKTYSAYYNEYC